MKKIILVLFLILIGFSLIGCTKEDPTVTEEVPKDNLSMMEELAEKMIEAFE